jgi:hypothetical protein
MRSHIDYDPALKMMLTCHRELGGLVPIAEGGELSQFVRPALCKDTVLQPDMAICDFVAGLELLGYRLAISEDATAAGRFTVV